MKDEEVKPKALVIPQLIVGLGNPEPKYDQTRHNIGFAAIDSLAHAGKFLWPKIANFKVSLAKVLHPVAVKSAYLNP